jgi:DNA-binding FadR family transcriptional regulator
MAIEYSRINKEGLSTQIADAIRTAIIEGRLVVEQRLPSETELAERFGVSRPTVREALKRLAAQNLIRTQRGPTGGAFVNRLTWSEAHDALVTTSTLLIGMNDIPFEDVVEARFALEASCVPLAAERRAAKHLDAMRDEIERQRDKGVSDEDFCASDIRFHRALADAAGNPVLSFQMAGAIEAMQPLMNMITYRMRDRAQIAALHTTLTEALEARDASAALQALEDLSGYTLELMAARRSAGKAGG